MRGSTEQTLNQAHRIAKSYNGNLTVRQLYYRMVAEAMIDNSERSYKRLISILSKARMAGLFPFEWLIDRTRECKPGDYDINQDSVQAALDNTASALRQAPESWIWRSRWWGQDTHVSVWVEKEALAGVFERPCRDLGVSWFVLRGYSSLSSLSQWVDQVRDAWNRNGFLQAVILYFGDHDPDGWEIPRSAERNIYDIAAARDVDLPPLNLERVALNMDQIREYDPPPFPAKTTSSRYDGYVEEHETDDAWELDALRPEVLDGLIRENVEAYFDEDVHLENLAVTESRRDEMRERMSEEGWAKDALREDRS